MGKCLVRFGHAVHIIFLPHRCSFAVRCIRNFRRETLDHRFLTAVVGRIDNPSKGERRSPLGPHLHRHLIRRSTDPSTANLYERSHVVDCFLKLINPFLPGPLLNELQRAVYNTLGHTSLPIPHHVIDKLGHHLTVIDRIG